MKFPVRIVPKMTSCLPVFYPFQTGGLGAPGAFAPEDLPSDHVGFWTYMNGKGEDRIPFVLESLGKVSPKLFPSWLATYAKNYTFTPMVRGAGGILWGNVPWPSWLCITPIPSGPDTLQRH